MKQILILAVFFLASIVSFGQRSGKDIVFLKNGNSFKGRIINRDPEKVKIVSGKNELIFNISETDSVYFDVSNAIVPFSIGDYFFDCSAGMLVGGSQNEKSAPFAFSASFNYRVFHKLEAGAGLGVEFWDESYMPVFANFQYKLRESRFSPIVGLQVGYLVSLGDAVKNEAMPYYSYSSSVMPYYSDQLQAQGGVVLNPSFGFRSMVSPNFGWQFTFGYRFHQLKYTGEDDYSIESNYNRLSLKVGIIFN